MIKAAGNKIAEGIRLVVPARYRPVGYLMQLTRERTGCTCHSGPFKNMHYLNDSLESAYIPKLLGIYERELHHVIEEMSTTNPEVIVDIGAAEGYYAVGMALRNQQSSVIAFEALATGREQLRLLADANGVVDRVDIKGLCQPQDLRSVLQADRSSAVICDVEGFETDLLDPESVPELCKASILVEIHEFISPGVTDLLRERFASTHDIDVIWQEERSRSEFPWRTVGTQLLPSSYIDWALSEWRPEKMSWLWMRPI